MVMRKERGETPLMALARLRALFPELSGVPLTYAGRLDPMATGTLLVLLGDECKRQEKYRGLDKEYEIEVLLDAGTDTGDLLGIPILTHAPTQQLDLRGILARETGTHRVPYPRFSSKTVAGKPLFAYSLEDSLARIEIPEHEETVYKIKHLNTRRVSRERLSEEIQEALAAIPRTEDPKKALGADFRQDQIRDAWRKELARSPQDSFVLVRLRVTAGSGTYMRSLAERIGEALGTRALAYSIHRTRIGKFSKTLRFWTKEYRAS